jgi:indolepyruvate ferredoxin oxidoreductase, beta subunit
MKKQTDSIYNIMIVGVGGQGVMRLAKFFREYGAQSADVVDLISAESRGVSQREGSVYALVRYNYAKGVDSCEIRQASLSPNPPKQNIQLMIAMEPLELLRNVQFLNETSVILLNLQENIPKSCITSDIHNYPDIASSISQLEDLFPKIQIIKKNYSQLAISKYNNSIRSNELIIEDLQLNLPIEFDAKLFAQVQSKFF